MLFRKVCVLRAYSGVFGSAYIGCMRNTPDMLQREWHPSKNEKQFTDYTRSSHHKSWWQCSDCSHEWQATICNRTQNDSKCPQCRKLNTRGNKNVAWKGHGEISGAQWHNIQREASQVRRNRRYTKPRPAIDFTITIEYIWDLFLNQDRKCALSGEPLTMWGKIDGKYTGTASLDRIDSSKGYVPGNVQWIDKKIQHVKTKLPDEEFITLCEKVAKFQATKKYGKVPSFTEWTKTTGGK
jgi:Probable Zinc-ribbon domain